MRRSSILVRVPLGLGLAALLFSGPVWAAPRCATPSAEPGAVMAALDQWYAAIRADDLDGFAKVTTSDFIAYDAGGVYPGLELARAIKAAHDSGKVFVWSVAAPKVQLDCRSALVTYVNKGQVKSADGVVDVVWLESAAFRREAGRWKLSFFHSSRAHPAR